MASLIVLDRRADASMFAGETLDAIADVVTWVVLIVAPVVAVGVFLVIHILPEKIAERRHHPQAKAIQCLCLLSLFFGGLLWPLAWLWAYTKPVLHDMAYGTKKSKGEEDTAPPQADELRREADQLRARIRQIEEKLSVTAHQEGGA